MEHHRVSQALLLTITELMELGNPITILERPIGFQEVEAPRFK
jgi:hypothetical protein